MGEKQIELHYGVRPRRLILIDARCSVINIPMPGADGFHEINFMASGLRTAAGLEIWTAQKRALQ